MVQSGGKPHPTDQWSLCQVVESTGGWPSQVVWVEKDRFWSFLAAAAAPRPFLSFPRRLRKCTAEFGDEFNS